MMYGILCWFNFPGQTSSLSDTHTSVDPAHLQCGEDNLIHGGEVCVPEHLCALSEGQNPVRGHRPHRGRNLTDRTRRSLCKSKTSAEFTCRPPPQTHSLRHTRLKSVAHRFY